MATIKKNIHLVYDILLNYKSSSIIEDEDSFICKEFQYYDNISMHLFHRAIYNKEAYTVEIIDNENLLSFSFGLTINENEFYMYFPSQVKYNKLKKIETPEGFFQQSLISDYYDLTLEDVLLINEIHKIMKGHFKKE